MNEFDAETFETSDYLFTLVRYPGGGIEIEAEHKESEEVFDFGWEELEAFRKMRRALRP